MCVELRAQLPAACNGDPSTLVKPTDVVTTVIMYDLYVRMYIHTQMRTQMQITSMTMKA